MLSLWTLTLDVVLAVVDSAAITRHTLCTTDTGAANIATACYVFVCSASNNVLSIYRERENQHACLRWAYNGAVIDYIDT
jgi:hypothetical protein